MNSIACVSLFKTGLLSSYRDRSMLITDLVIATGIPFFIQFAVWTFVYEGARADELPGYSLDEMYLYYICVLALGRFNNAYDLVMDVSEHVRQGQLESFFVKPLSYLSYHFYIFLGGASLYFIPLVVIAVYMGFTGTGWVGPLGFLGLSVLNLVLCFIVGFLMSLAAFWLTKSDMIISFQVVLSSVVGGTLLPLSYWPETIKPFMQYNPFRLFISGPAEFLLRPSMALGVELLLLFIVWFVLIYGACSIFYKLACVRYSSVGG